LAITNWSIQNAKGSDNIKIKTGIIKREFKQKAKQCNFALEIKKGNMIDHLSTLFWPTVFFKSHAIRPRG